MSTNICVLKPEALIFKYLHCQLKNIYFKFFRWYIVEYSLSSDPLTNSSNLHENGDCLFKSINTNNMLNVDELPRPENIEG